MSGASRTLTPCRCACSTSSSTVRSSKSASVRITSSGFVWPSTSGKLGSRPEKLEPGDGLRRDDADELVREPAAGRLEGRAQAHEALARADEHDASPDPGGAHDLERGRLVRGAKQPDRHRRDDDGRRDEARGREVVSRSDPEREHDERDDDEAREDPARTRPQLALAVETRLREDEDRDRSGELEPLRWALAPEQAPEDVPVPGDHLTDDEREVDPEGEADDVEDDERGDGERAPDDGEDRPPREHVETRGADVTIRCALCRRRARRLRRRSDLAGHPADVRAAPRRPTRHEARRAGAAWRASRGRSPVRAVRAAGSTTRRSALLRRSSRSVSWKYTWTRSGRSRRRSARARSPSECVVGIAPSTRPDGSSTDAGLVSEAQRSPWREVRRPRGTRSAVDVPELRTRLGDVDVRVPAAAAEERRRESEPAESSSSLRGRARRWRRRSAARDRAQSSACDAREGHASTRRARARARSSRPRRTQDRPAA